jgi:formylmethanofuran dehydrogenase subunit E
MNAKIMNHAELDALLDRCVAYHGHLCMGQVLGVKLAVKGLALAAPATPRDLIVVVENDRCIADAIQTITGTRMGRRTFKLKDYGRMAATFINTTTQRAYRVHTAFAGTVDREDEKAVRAVLHLPDEQVVAWQEVEAHLRPEEMPGKPQRVVNCIKCGEKVFDSKDQVTADGPVCLACSQGAYYTPVGQ